MRCLSVKPECPTECSCPGLTFAAPEGGNCHRTETTWPKLFQPKQLLFREGTTLIRLGLSSEDVWEVKTTSWLRGLMNSYYLWDWGWVNVTFSLELYFSSSCPSLPTAYSCVLTIKEFWSLCYLILLGEICTDIHWLTRESNQPKAKLKCNSWHRMAFPPKSTV